MLILCPKERGNLCLITIVAWFLLHDFKKWFGITGILLLLLTLIGGFVFFMQDIIDRRILFHGETLPIILIFAFGIVAYVDIIEKKISVIGKIIRFLIVVLPFVVLTYDIYIGVIEGDIIPIIISFQIISTLFYLIYPYIKRRLIEKKHFEQGISTYDKDQK